MVEPAGAMAMFVLRLAGLLSLENALQEQEANLTESDYNFTSLDLSPTTTRPVNLTWPVSSEAYPTTTPTVIRENSFTTTSPERQTTPALRSSAPSTTVSTTSYTTTLGNSHTTSPSRKSRVRDHISPVPPIDVNNNKNITKFNRRRIPFHNAKRRKFPRGQVGNANNSSAGYSQMTHVRISGHEEIRDVEDSYEQIPKPNVSEAATVSHQTENVPENVVTSPSFERLVQDEEDAKRFGMSTVVPSTEQISSSSIAPEVTDIPHPESSSSSFSWTSTTNPIPTTENSEPLQVTDSPRHESSSTSSSWIPASSSWIPTQNPSPRLEMVAEDHEPLEGLGEHFQLKSLEAPRELTMTGDFDYFDFGSHATMSLSTEAPTLSSLNLVSAVPVGRFAPATVPSEPINREQSEETRQPQQKQPRKLPPARPIPPAYPRSGMRNNPYPYGPKLLPGPYGPLTPNLPSASEEDTRDRHVTTEYSYEEDFDYYYESHDSEDSRYEVQTKEPPVLFVFDKPGYSPEAPTTLPAPTRSPTPSDPWDCAPRCPRYTLLDWNTDYDVRQYPETLWVSTVIISDNRVLAELEGYMRVQDYFYGLNDQGKVLNLTIPFVTQIKFGKHPGVLHETNDYTISLYVQPTYYLPAELPTPISNEVLVDVLEPKTVFVHSFEANVWDVTAKFLEEKVETLMTQLRHNGEAFLDRYYYLASYSRPELYQPVYYEVWVYATNFRDPQTSATPAGIRRMPQTNKITEKTLSKLCRGVECPSFEVLRTYKYGIQKRRYFNALFASTSPRECQFTTMSVWKGFMPLHLYKHGINSHMEVIEATRPIALVNIRDSSDPNTECPQNMTMSLYLPQRLHSNPPVTGYAAPEVHITAMNDVIVYAYTVGGYLLDPRRVRKELADMKYRLSEFGACYKDNEYYVVIYDFIVRYHGRQNEIWIVAENCKATHNG